MGRLPDIHKPSLQEIKDFASKPFEKVKGFAKMLKPNRGVEGKEKGKSTSKDFKKAKPEPRASTKSIIGSDRDKKTKETKKPVPALPPRPTKKPERAPPPTPEQQRARQTAQRQGVDIFSMNPDQLKGKATRPSKPNPTTGPQKPTKPAPAAPSKTGAPAVPFKPKNLGNQPQSNKPEGGVQMPGMGKNSELHDRISKRKEKAEEGARVSQEGKTKKVEDPNQAAKDKMNVAQKKRPPTKNPLRK